MSEEFVNELQNSKQLILIVHIYDDSGWNLYLTNSTEKIYLKDKVYLPYSGLQIKDVDFSENILANYVEIIGVFEQNGITTSEDIMQKNINISVLIGNKIYEFIDYFCYKAIHDGIRFTLVLKSKVAKLANISINEFYSINCRANFADKRCKCHKYEYTDKIDIVSIKNKIVKFHSNTQRANGYYNLGEIVIKSLNFKAKIIKHQLNVIELDAKILYQAGSDNLEAYLTAGCDKTIKTCIKKFNNAINFRGEPFIDA